MKVWFIRLCVYQDVSELINGTGLYAVVGKKKTIGQDLFWELLDNKQLLKYDMVPYSSYSGAMKRCKKIQEAYSKQSKVVNAYVVYNEVTPDYKYELEVTSDKNPDYCEHLNRGFWYNKKDDAEYIRRVKYEVGGWAKSTAYKQAQEYNSLLKSHTHVNVVKYPVF